MNDGYVFMMTSTILIFLGISYMAYSKNLLKSIMSFQVLIFGVNLALFSSGIISESKIIPNTLVIFSIVVGASVEALGLAIIILVYKKYGSLNPWEIRKLKA